MVLLTEKTPSGRSKSWALGAGGAHHPRRGSSPLFTSPGQEVILVSQLPPQTGLVPVAREGSLLPLLSASLTGPALLQPWALGTVGAA